jgi:hypothetical protein
MRCYSCGAELDHDDLCSYCDHGHPRQTLEVGQEQQADAEWLADYDAAFPNDHKKGLGFGT